MMIRFGVLGAAGIAIRHVIPAMQRGRYTRVTAIGSRNRAKAAAVAARLNVPMAYGSYEEVLASADVDAVYVPLPNHLHVPWSIRALEAGKHVLCEKPIAMDAREAESLARAAARFPRLNVMEAFMYRFHPQWQRAKALVDESAIGSIAAVHTSFTYANDDPRNIRNIRECGGGALMDIGCYGISVARFLFGREPQGVTAWTDRHPQFGTDRRTAAAMDFGDATATFFCATDVARSQRVEILGTSGRLEIEVPFNAPPDRAARILLHRGPGSEDAETIDLDPCDQYTEQGDRFALAVLKDLEVPTPLADAIANMTVIDAIRASAESTCR